ncbi:hypothetical protein BU23DRAFT_595122 [Bimuria novae-zelandiae CBS 107.79]|uniref:Heterokaryon incompatibility domain-containing protein n=1 Tax=Bimuria novae-zelandiae CBS 107.79 TaxID=1447943 RepID=A0A6A5VP81_9PLEO|nr:hypothetical protein BU23DRAFT_595122 [Bimuria novae-zelandiae CBS 107.79]
MPRIYKNDNGHRFWKDDSELRGPEAPRSLNRRRHRSHDERGGEQSRAQLNYDSDNETVDHHPTDERGTDRQHKWRRTGSPTLTRLQIPSPPRVASGLGLSSSPDSHSYDNEPSGLHMVEDQEEIPVPPGWSRKRVPSPPCVSPVGDDSQWEPIDAGPVTRSSRSPSPQAPWQTNFGFRDGKQPHSSRKTSSRRLIRTHNGFSYDDDDETSVRYRGDAIRDASRDRGYTKYVLLPPTMRRTQDRSHSSQIPDSVLNMATSRNDRMRSLQQPQSVPGSSIVALDDILLDGSRPDYSPSGYRLLSGGAASLVSETSPRPSVLPSVPGVLGENVYRYKPLGAFQFRLVRILPRKMSPIKCELVHYSLEDPPSYIAVSYAWGDTDDRKTIRLEGIEIPVAASLHGALFALRAKKENESDTAMQTLIEITASASNSEVLRSLTSSTAGKAQLSSVVALFEREYWSRLWPVQEVFNAREITVYCGAMAVPWSIYRLSCNAFRAHKGLIDRHFTGSINNGGLRASSTHFTYSQVLAYHGPSSIPDVSSFRGLGEESLLEVLRVCRRKLSADPKDKLYDILGLLAEEIRNEFPVDYGLSVKEIFVRVFDYLLCTTERLDVMCEAVHFPLHTGSSLPTWVPDWSHNPETTALGQSYEFSASGPKKAVARVLDDRRKLQMSAIHLGTIRSHGIAVGTLCTLADYIMAFIHWRAQLLSNTEDGENQARQEEFCSTLSLDQLPPGWKIDSWRAACYHVFASLAHQRIPRLPLDEELQRYIDADVGVKAEDRRRFLQEHFGSQMMGRCFCITEDGEMGMGSGFMTAGDTVVIPLGCPTPVLIRPEGTRGEYRYVGDVYIHGYMNGKAVDQWKDGERELRQYILH